MKDTTTSAAVVPAAIVEEAWQEVGASFERFCLHIPRQGGRGFLGKAATDS